MKIPIAVLEILGEYGLHSSAGFPQRFVRGKWWSFNECVWTVQWNTCWLMTGLYQCAVWFYS